MGRKAVTINPIKGERLKQLLQEYNVSQKEIASVLNYSPEQISYIINGKRNLTEPAAKEIIKYFNSFKEAEMAKSKTENKPLRAERVNELISESGMTQKEFAEKVVHCTQQHMSRMVKEKAPVTAETADQITKYFPEIRFEWLMGYDNVKTAQEHKRNNAKAILGAMNKFESQMLAALDELYNAINYFEEAYYEKADK